MISGWRKQHLLRVGIVLLILVFACTAAADAAACQKMTGQSSNCLLRCHFCQLAGVIQASPVMHVDCVTSCVQIPVTMAPVFLASALFHPPRA